MGNKNGSQVRVSDTGSMSVWTDSTRGPYMETGKHRVIRPSVPGQQTRNGQKHGYPVARTGPTKHAVRKMSTDNGRIDQLRSSCDGITRTDDRKRWSPRYNDSYVLSQSSNEPRPQNHVSLDPSTIQPLYSDPFVLPYMPEKESKKWKKKHRRIFRNLSDAGDPVTFPGIIFGPPPSVFPYRAQSTENLRSYNVPASVNNPPVGVVPPMYRSCADLRKGNGKPRPVNVADAARYDECTRMRRHCPVFTLSYQNDNLIENVHRPQDVNGESSRQWSSDMLPHNSDYGQKANNGYHRWNHYQRQSDPSPCDLQEARSSDGHFTESHRTPSILQQRGASDGKVSKQKVSLAISSGNEAVADTIRDMNSSPREPQQFLASADRRGMVAATVNPRLFHGDRESALYSAQKNDSIDSYFQKDHRQTAMSRGQEQEYGGERFEGSPVSEMWSNSSILENVIQRGRGYYDEKKTFDEGVQTAMSSFDSSVRSAASMDDIAKRPYNNQDGRMRNYPCGSKLKMQTDMVLRQIASAHEHHPPLESLEQQSNVKSSGLMSIAEMRQSADDIVHTPKTKPFGYRMQQHGFRSDSRCVTLPSTAEEIDSGDIDFSWVNDLENKLKQEREYRSVIASAQRTVTDEEETRAKYSSEVSPQTTESSYYRTSSRQSGTNDESSTEMSIREPLRYFGQKTVVDRSTNSPRTLPVRDSDGKMSLQEMRTRSMSAQNHEGGGLPPQYSSGIDSIYIPEPDYDSEEASSIGRDTKESQNSASPPGEERRRTEYVADDSGYSSRLDHALPQEDAYQRTIHQENTVLPTKIAVPLNFTLSCATSFPQLNSFPAHSVTTSSSETHDSHEFSSGVYRGGASQSKQFFYIPQSKNAKASDSRNATATTAGTMSRL